MGPLAEGWGSGGVDFNLQKTLVEDVENLSEWDTNPLNADSLFLISFYSLPFISVALHKQTHTNLTQVHRCAHTLLASLSSLRRLYCFTADCEDCTK